MQNKTLTGKQIRHLRSLGHHLPPVMIIGGNRITEGVTKHVNQVLEQHELIKIRVSDAEKAEVIEVGEQLCEQTGAIQAQRIGHTLLLYRKRLEGKPTIKLPR